MTLKERADIIIGGVMGSPQLEDSDKEFVVQKLRELLEEAAGVVCRWCKDGTPRERVRERYFHIRLPDRAYTEICPATGIWDLIEGG